MVAIGSVLAIDGVVAAGVVRALHPDLAQVAVPALALGLGVGDDHRDAGQQFAGLHQGQRVRAASFHQRYSVVPEFKQFLNPEGKSKAPERPEINIDGGGVGRGSSLQADRDVLPAPERGRDCAR